jgi:hypothetical protein
MVMAETQTVMPDVNMTLLGLGAEQWKKPLKISSMLGLLPT